MENTKQMRATFAEIRSGCIQMGKSLHSFETGGQAPPAELVAELLYALFEMQRKTVDVLVQVACWELIQLRTGEAPASMRPRA